jgi:hypothetical protein
MKGEVMYEPESKKLITILVQSPRKAVNATCYLRDESILLLIYLNKGGLEKIEHPY